MAALPFFVARFDICFRYSGTSCSGERNFCTFRLYTFWATSDSRNACSVFFRCSKSTFSPGFLIAAVRVSETNTIS